MNPIRSLRTRAAALFILLLAGLAAGAASGLAYAAAPMSKTTAPGWYRMQLGDFEITALSDGTRVMPVQKLLKEAPAGTRRALAAAFLPQPYEMNFNAFLIDTGHELILIDTGAGDFLGKDLGEMTERLRASGYRLDQVDAVYITHLHPDHAGGLIANGRRVFPNAVVRVNQRDADYWLNPANMEKASADQKVLFKGAMAAIAPYRQAGRFKPFRIGDALDAGIRAVPLYGHTPGHTGYLVESRGKKMLVWGDIIHVAAVQFADPAVSIDFDTDPAQAVATRKRILAEAASKGWLIAGAHLPFPGLGHVIKDGSGYRWLPVSYREIH
ncbi:MAG: MBL fold metallo-hydrolase [Rhodanobacteraceae bacterium]